jgi:hypothetical protein
VARGYGLLAEVAGVPVRAPARRGPEAALPALRVKPTGVQEAARRDADGDPQRRVVDEEDLVPRKQTARAKKKAPAGEDDEDLLP